MNPLNVRTASRTSLIAALSLTALLAMLLPPPARSQPASPLPVDQPIQNATNVFTVAGRTPNSRIWQSVSFSTNPVTGSVHARTNTIVELGTGIHFTDAKGNLAETREEILLYPDSSAASATNGPCKLFLPADVSQGVIEIIGPAGRVQRSHPLGLAFTQGSNSLFVAGITNAIGKLLPTENQVLYENLINEAGFLCDLLVTYRARGIECDLVIRAAASPAQWSFDPELCSLQFLTEFFETDPPLQTNQKIDASTQSQTADISFGALSMRPGQAFSVGTQATPSPLGQQSAGRKTPQDLAVERQPVPISRTWQELDKRSFICESAPWKLLAPQIARLSAAMVPGNSPAARTASTDSKNSQTPKLSNSQTSLVPLRLPPPVPVRPGSAKMQLASLAPTASPGLIWDYEEVYNSTPSFTFTNTTFFVSSSFVIGSAELCSGAVIKLNPGAEIDVTGSLKCSTSFYRPCIFTSVNDNTAGEILPTSTGSPELGDAGVCCLCISDFSAEISYLRFSYSYNPVIFVDQVGDKTLSVWHCQFPHSGYAILSWAGTLNVYNSLFTEGDGFYPILCDANTVVNARNVTAANCDALVSTDYPAAVTLQNCLVWDGSNVSIDGGDPINDAAPFQSSVGGNYYLADQSPWRAAGTSSGLSSRLLADLRNKTTSPPIVTIGRNIPAGGLNLFPQAQRNGSRIPVGFSYDPIDWAFAGVVSTNACPINVAPGTVIAAFGTNTITYGLGLGSGASLHSQGTAENPVWITSWNTVQESSEDLRQPGVGLINNSFTPAVGPSDCRFTFWSSPANNVPSLYFNSASFDMADCQFYGGRVQFPELPSGAIRNCLFERVSCDLTLDTGTLRNNLFFGGGLMITLGGGTCEDNLFCRTAITYSDVSAATVDHNAYVTNFDYLDVTGATDVFLTNTDFQVGPRGDYYYKTNGGMTSLLRDAGSAAHAGDVGLYHYTTTTNIVDGQPSKGSTSKGSTLKGVDP